MVYENYPDRNNHDASTYLTYLNPSGGSARKVLLKFGTVPAEYKYKALYSAEISAYYYGNESGNATIIRPYLLNGNAWKDFDETTITWNSTPPASQWRGIGLGYTFSSSASSAQISTPKSFFTDEDQSALAQRFANEVVWLFPYLSSAGSSDSIILENDSTHSPELLVTILENITVTSKISVTGKPSGYVSPYANNFFSWEYVSSGSYLAIGPWEQQSATFYWRTVGASAWNSVSAGTATQITIAANTFPVGSIEWYVSGTDTLGTTTQTPVYTLSTTAAQSVATPVAPIDTLVDSSDDVTFSWSVSNANNQTQTGADIQYSADGGSTWTMLAQPTGNVRSVDVAPGSMPGGSLQWRVRSYNVDGSAGSWSTPVSFYYIGAPGAPVVSATAVPFTTVTWAAAGQQAYEVTVDGISQGVKFGTGKTFSVAEPLIDGPHTIRVRIQGIYGLWSSFGSVTINVTNVPGDAIALTGAFGVDALLNWETLSAATPFYVYRDDVRIGRTPGSSFRDRFVLGEHSYFVLLDHGDGNYTKSNIVTGAMSVSMPHIAAAVNGDWLPLRLSENSVSSQSFTFNRSHSLRHVTATDFPVCEIAQFRDLSGSYDVAFPNAAEAAALEALFGQIVVVKSRGGSVVIGPLVTLNKLHTDFYLTYSFTVQQIAWEDFVDVENTGI